MLLFSGESNIAFFPFFFSFSHIWDPVGAATILKDRMGLSLDREDIQSTYVLYTLFSFALQFWLL